MTTSTPVRDVRKFFIELTEWQSTQRIAFNLEHISCIKPEGSWARIFIGDKGYRVQESYDEIKQRLIELR